MAQLKNGKEYMADMFTEDRPVYNKIEIDHSTYPESQIRHKIAKARGWQVCKSGCDEKTKSFWYERVINAEETKMENVTFDQVCAELHWSDMKIMNNGQSVKWTRDKQWDKEAEEISDRCHKEALKAAAALPKKKELVWQKR